MAAVVILSCPDFLHAAQGLEQETTVGKKIEGRTQTWGTKTFGHGPRQNLEAWKYALNPRVEKVTMSLRWSTLADIKTPTKGTWYPDVGVKFKNGTYKVIEVQSKTDKMPWLRDKHILFMKKNGIGGRVSVVKPLWLLS